jgi:hypothetical protein
MTLETQYSYKQLVSSSDHSFDEFYRIYTASMPIRKQKPKTQISTITSKPDYKILLLNRNTEVIGFSMLFTPPPPQMSFFASWSIWR